MEHIKREDRPANSGDAPYVNEVRERIHFDEPLSDEQKDRLLKVAAKCPVHLTMEYPTIFVESLVGDASR